MMAESAVYRFYRRIRFPLPYDHWRKLPRALTHKNEYIHGGLLLTPRPKYCNVFLRLEGWSPPITCGADERPGRLEVATQTLTDVDWGLLPTVYHSAFASLQPLYSWNKHGAATASRAIMRWSRLGKDGPLIADACFSARARSFRRNDTEELELCGGAIVTLLKSNPWVGVPADAANEVPHLDWIFVSRYFKRNGVATLLLEDVVRVLRSQGHRYLASTFVTDNTESMQWHWRNGFVLGPQPYGAGQAVRIPR